MLAVELKQSGNRATPEQQQWIADLQARGFEAHIFVMPTDWFFSRTWFDLDASHASIGPTTPS